MKKGIDVSYCQENLNYQAVKDGGIDFAIIRCGFGSPDPSQVDKLYKTHVNGFKSVGIPIGIYHYGYAVSEQEAINEANFCLSIIAGDEINYPVFYDIEENCMFDVGRDELTAIANAFCRTVENAGYKTGVYMSCGAAESRINMDQVPYDKWIAQYYSECQYNGDFAMWQYTSSGEIDGINGRLDMNYCYKEYGETPAPITPPADIIEWVWNDSSKLWQVKKNGMIMTGWFNDGGKWYYLDPKTTYMRTGWIQDGGTDWYYLKPDKGEMVTGWFFDEKEKGWYYLHPVNGKMAKGWITVEGKKYYLKPDFGGKMARNEYLQTGGMTKYWFNDKGENVE